MTDKKRLDTLQKLTAGYGNGWICILSTTKRGMRLHESSRGDATLNIRDAIDNFIRESKPFSLKD